MSGSFWATLQAHWSFGAEETVLWEPGKRSLRRSDLTEGMKLTTAAVVEAGVARGSVVAVVLPDGIAHLVTTLALLDEWCVAPLNPESTRDELQTDATQMNLAAVVCTAGSHAEWVARANGLGVILVEESMAAESGLQWRVAAKSTGEARTREWAMLMTTSATTGRRKLVPFERAALWTMLEQTIASTKLSQCDRLLLLARQFHVQGVISPLAQMCVGGSVVCTRGYNGGEFARWIREYAPTWYACGPAVHRKIVALGQNLSGSSLRFVRSGGAALPMELREQIDAVLGVKVLDVYGLTETGALAATSIGGSGPRGSVGRSVGAEMAVLDENGRFVTGGKQGEIVVRGANIFGGYVNDDEANREAFHEGWFRTGDLGRIDAEGYLFLRGRLKEIINRGGQKVIPEEVDAAIGRHESVAEVATFGMLHASLGEEVACAVVLRAACTLTEQDVRRFARESLALYKTPRRIYFLDELPRGSTGKAQRQKLREWAEVQHASRSTADTAAAGSGLEDAENAFDNTEEHLTQLWRALLGVETIEREEDFFQAGGDSLAAVELLAELDKEFSFSQALSAEAFLERPTIAGLLAMLERALTQEECTYHTSIVYPVTAGAGGAPLYLLPALNGKGLYFRRLARHMGAASGERCAISLLRPAELGPFRAMNEVEDTARVAVEALRRTQPKGPYAVGGFCEGGVIAFEVALQLERQGEQVRVALWDTPLLTDAVSDSSWSVLGQHARSRWKDALRSRSVKPLTNAARGLTRRMTWNALAKMLAANAVQGGARQTNHRLAHQLMKMSSAPPIALYRPQTAGFDLLHLVAEGEAHALRSNSRLGWAQRTRGKTSHAEIAGDHKSLFAEQHLPRMSELLWRWLETGDVQGMQAVKRVQ